MIVLLALLAAAARPKPAPAPPAPSTAAAPGAPGARPAAGAPDAAAAGGLALTGVTAEKSDFKPGAGEAAAWRFRVSAEARLKARVYDARNLLVRSLEDDDVPAGDRRLRWDGKDDLGRVAPPGYYLLTLEATGKDGTVRYDPSDATGGEATQAAAVAYDRAMGTVRYALQKPAIVRIQAGLKNDGPLLRTILDWVARPSGEHAEPWDGWDASGVIRFADSAMLDVQVAAYTLPVNAVVIDDEAPAPSAPVRPAASPAPPAASPRRARFLDFAADRPARARDASRPHEMYNHWQHDRSRCHSPVATVRAVGVEAAAGGAVPVTGSLALRLDLPADDAAFLLSERFETVVYLDGVYAFEEEQAYLPFTWNLKAEMLSPGEHVVTFVLRGYEGHFATSSIKVARAAAPTATAAIGRK